MKRKLLSLFFIFSLGIFMQNCRKDLSKFYLKKGSLDHLPIAMDEFISLTPLGSVGPPGHVFPNDHMGFYYVKDIKPVTIFSPGNLHLSEIRSSVYNPGEANETADYSLTFGINGESTLIFGHISSLTPKLMQAFGNNATCEQYSAGTVMVKSCIKKVSMEIQSGELIGYSNTVPGQQALDMGVYLNNQGVSPLDYFEQSVRSQLETRLMGPPNSQYDGVLRTELPLAGEINQDLIGALQGRWYKKGAPKFPESPHISFVKDYIKPSELHISSGTSVPVFGPGVWKFNQNNTGEINRAFKDVKVDGKIYCFDPLYLSYDPAYPAQGTFPNNSLIVKLEDQKTLFLETRDCNCAEQIPYQFTAAKLTFVRY
ncbi:MAG: hypothetical protein RI924_645 [Bacteroidota bacterium]|jgi:hypothetical protein